jgi:hypothetical protein
MIKITPLPCASLQKRLQLKCWITLEVTKCSRLLSMTRRAFNSNGNNPNQRRGRQLCTIRQQQCMHSKNPILPLSTNSTNFKITMCQHPNLKQKAQVSVNLLHNLVFLFLNHPISMSTRSSKRDSRTSNINTLCQAKRNLTDRNHTEQVADFLPAHQKNNPIYLISKIRPTTRRS